MCAVSRNIFKILWITLSRSNQVLRNGPHKRHALCMHSTDSPPTRSRYSFRLPAEKIERWRAVSGATGMHMSYLIENAVEAYLVGLGLEDENGGPFPPRHGKMPRGRPTNARVGLPA